MDLDLLDDPETAEDGWLDVPELLAQSEIDELLLARHERITGAGPDDFDPVYD